MHSKLSKFPLNNAVLASAKATWRSSTLMLKLDPMSFAFLTLSRSILTADEVVLVERLSLTPRKLLPEVDILAKSCDGLFGIFHAMFHEITSNILPILTTPGNYTG